MKLAMRLPSRAPADNRDPRDEHSAEIIDLATRNPYPAVTQRKGRSDALGLAAGVAVVALVGMATLWGMDSARLEKQRPQAQATSQGVAAPPAETPPFVLPKALSSAPAQTAQTSPAPAPAPAPAPVLAREPHLAPAGNAYNTPTVVFDASALPAPAAGAPPAPGAPAGEAGGGDTASAFASRIGGVGGAPAQARADFDPQTTVTEGTMIPAILETAINTDVPGYVRAVVSQDVRSFDGSRVLVPRSSRLIGRYQSGLQGGQKRAYVIWTRLIRPDGVSVALASPGTGFDGAAPGSKARSTATSSSASARRCCCRWSAASPPSAPAARA